MSGRTAVCRSAGPHRSYRLSSFAYRAGINPLLFVLAAAAAAAVAFGTVALQSLKTARADPVEALRHVEG